MSLNSQQLDDLVTVADPAVSDADLAAQLSTPAKTPKRDPVTAKTVGGAWGPSRLGQFLRALQSGAAMNDAALSALTLLNGPGLDASDPATAPTAEAFVAAGLCSQAEADAVLYDVSFPAGDVVQASDVTAGRARVADRAARAKIVNALASVLNEWLPVQTAAPNAAAVTARAQAALSAAGVA